MRLSGVSFDGVRGLFDRSYSFVDPASGRGHDLVVVTGRPASGKTTFLEAIIAAKELVAPYGARSLGSTSLVRRDGGHAKVALSWDLSAREIAESELASPVRTEAIFGPGKIEPGVVELSLAGILGHWSTSMESGKLEYFDAERRLPLSAGGGPLEPDGAARFVRLTREANKYSFVPSFLAQAAGSSRRAAVNAALSRICSTKTLAGAHPVEGTLEPFFLDHKGEPSSYHALTGSERQSVLLASTFVWAGLHDSLVLIDVPERDIDETRVVEFVHGLGQLGLGNQLIVASGSRALAQSVPPTALVVLK